MSADRSRRRPRPGTGASVAELRALISDLEGAPSGARDATPCGLEALDRRLPGGGLPNGAVIELFHDDRAGAGAVRLAALWLRELDPRRAVWLEETWRGDAPELYPPALAALGVSLERLIILRPPDRRKALHALEELVRCAQLPLTIAALSGLSATVVRRLQIGTEESGRRLVLIRPERESRSGAAGALRLRLRAAPLEEPGDPFAGGRSRRARSFILEPLRCRGAPFLPPLRMEIDGVTGTLAASALLSERAKSAPA